MHELSVVMSIICIAEQEAAKQNAQQIEAITIEIGQLSGIEMTAFDFAWQQAVKNTLLANTAKQVLRTAGKAVCLNCAAGFALQQLYEPCPQCGSHFINIKKGKELRVKSLVLTAPEFINSKQ